MAKKPMPKGGMCSACKHKGLKFNKDGTGSCPNCGRKFVWDKERPGAVAPAKPAKKAIPKGGTCSTCNHKGLIFHKDGTGECPKCARLFIWDRDSAEAQHAYKRRVAKLEAARKAEEEAKARNEAEKRKQEEARKKAAEQAKKKAEEERIKKQVLEQRIRDLINKAKVSDIVADLHFTEVAMMYAPITWRRNGNGLCCFFAPLLFLGLLAFFFLSALYLPRFPDDLLLPPRHHLPLFVFRQRGHFGRWGISRGELGSADSRLGVPRR